MDTIFNETEKDSEPFFKKHRRLKNRTKVYTATYKKRVEFFNTAHLIEWINQNDIIVYVNSAGTMDDGTEFIQVTIEGFNP